MVALVPLAVIAGRLTTGSCITEVARTWFEIMLRIFSDLLGTVTNWGTVAVMRSLFSGKQLSFVPVL